MTEDPRFVHLGVRVDRLESDMIDIKNGVQKLLDRPQNPGLMQVAAGAVTVLILIGFIFGFARYNIGGMLSPLEAALATHDRRLDKVDDEHRMTQIKLAVLEERANWIKSSGGWGAKVEKP